MEGHLIYPDKITEVFVGRTEMEGYECPKQCIEVKGYIAQGELKTIYFDCPYGTKGDDCKYLQEFLKGGAELGIKKVRGNQDKVISDLVEAIQDTKVTNVRIPFKIGFGEDISFSERMSKFFIAFLEYETGLHDVEDRSFVLEIRKGKKRRKSLKDVLKAIPEYFRRKES